MHGAGIDKTIYLQDTNILGLDRNHVHGVLKPRFSGVNCRAREAGGGWLVVGEELKVSPAHFLTNRCYSGSSRRTLPWNFSGKH